MARPTPKKAAAPLTVNRRIDEDDDASRGREVFGVIALGASLFVFMAMVSLQAGALFMGPFGRTIAGLVYGIAGVGSYALVTIAVIAAVRSLMQKDVVLPWEIGAGVSLGVVSIGVLLHLVAARYRIAGFGPGGAIGEHLAEVLRAMISTAGTALLAAVSLAIAVIIATPLRMRQVLRWIAAGLRAAWVAIADAVRTTCRFIVDVGRAIMPERREECDDADEDEDPLAVDDSDLPQPLIIDRAAPAVDFIGDTERTTAPAADEPGKARKKKTEPVKKPEAVIVEDSAPIAVAAVAVPRLPAAAAAAAATPAVAGTAPLIVESRFKHADKAEMAAKEKQAEAERGFIKLGDGAYQLPAIGLLNYDAATQNQIDKTEMLELSARLARTLENYGVKGDVVAIRPGPVVTMYEFAPAPGIRVAKIASLADDLAMSLEALRVRIVAPIPGKAAVGIEVPNKSREKVFLKEIIADDLFRKSKSRLPMALGKDIEGGPAVVDLARMPHLLVAGTTGSGKSVAVNAMITSLLYNCSPDDVRLIMVDPKMLELSIYEGIPHLLLPVVTDPKKANLALRWAVDEMDRRYELLAQQGVRDIVGYNDKLAKQRAKWEADKLRRAADAAERAAGEQLAFEVADEQIEHVEVTTERPPHVVTEPAAKMPYIVVVIDEFADLMMCAPKEVETSVARIAQKARACGIHLILATQRPSVDVITGLIKANFPSRIAFHVTAKVDSRTILDQGGAEALLGAGDMLFSDRGAAPSRLHGCYVDEDEIHRVVAFLKTQGRPVYNLDILRPREEDEGDGAGADGPSGGGGKIDDEMYDKAVNVVTSTGNASISWVQRQLRIGYNRAARIVEEMEKQGVVSAPDHTNKREVLVSAA